jgi:hypothetical protein
VTATRHWFVREPLVLPVPLDLQLSKAAEYEFAGNWYLAAETYVALKDQGTASLSAIERGKVLARAASCFELARDSKVSARLYEEAAREIAALNSDPQLVAELSNRAALQFRDASEFLFAGSAWVRTAEEFMKIGATIINCTENFTPLPVSAFKSHLCGVCFEASYCGTNFSGAVMNWSRFSADTNR